MNLKPLGDRVIVEAEAAEEKTESGILLAKSAQEKPQRGTVLAVGEGKFDENGKRIPVDVQVGDTIIYGKYSGSEVKVEGKDYLIMRADDIYAVVK